MRGEHSPLEFAIKDVIRQRLQELGLTQADMARDLGISTKHVSMVLTGNSVGSVHMLDQMLAYVGVKVLFTSSEGPSDD